MKFFFLLSYLTVQFSCIAYTQNSNDTCSIFSIRTNEYYIINFLSKENFYTLKGRTNLKITSPKEVKIRPILSQELMRVDSLLTIYFATLDDKQPHKYIKQLVSFEFKGEWYVSIFCMNVEQLNAINYRSCTRLNLQYGGGNNYFCYTYSLSKDELMSIDVNGWR